MAGVETDDALVTQLTDTHLAQQARSGDSASFIELYRRYSATSARFAAVVIGGSELVADVVSEGFGRSLAVPFDVHSDFGQPFLPELLRTIRQAAIAVTGRRGFDARQLAHVVPNDSDSELVLHVFGRLPEPERSALWLTSVAGLSAANAGLTLDLSEAEVVRLVDRASEQLGSRRQAAITALHGLRMPLPADHLATTMAAQGYRARQHQGGSLLERRPRIAARWPVESWLRPVTANPARSGALALLVILVVGIFLIESKGGSAGTFQLGGDDNRATGGQQRTVASAPEASVRGSGGSRDDVEPQPTIGEPVGRGLHRVVAPSDRDDRHEPLVDHRRGPLAHHRRSRRHRAARAASPDDERPDVDHPLLLHAAPDAPDEPAHHRRAAAPAAAHPAAERPDHQAAHHPPAHHPATDDAPAHHLADPTTVPPTTTLPPTTLPPTALPPTTLPPSTLSAHHAPASARPGPELDLSGRRTLVPDAVSSTSHPSAWSSSRSASAASPVACGPGGVALARPSPRPRRARRRPATRARGRPRCRSRRPRRRAVPAAVDIAAVQACWPARTAAEHEIDHARECRGRRPSVRGTGRGSTASGSAVTIESAVRRANVSSRWSAASASAVLARVTSTGER